MPKKKKSKRGGARPGSGRPTVMPGCVALTVRLSGDQKGTLDEYCESRNLTRAEAIRRAVAWLLDDE